MSFAGVSAISKGKLLGADTSPIFNAHAASGYHLLVFQGHSRNRKPIWSHSFTIGGQRWRIHYIPWGNAFIALQLSLAESTTTKPVMLRLMFSFVDQTDKQEPACVHGSENYFLKKIHKSELFEFHYGKLEIIKSETLEKHLKDNSFSIRCDIVVVNPTCGISPSIVVPPSDMQQDFTDLLLAGHGTDVVFRVGGETIAAHQCVLAARSAVFKAALFGPMKEATSLSTPVAPVVQIDDIDAAVFKAMLGFIYGDTLPALKDDSEDEHVALLQHLLVAADRYDLRRLILMCEKKLCEHMGVGTVTSHLALADQHGCDGLKKACYEFLRCPDNLRGLLATDGFDYRSCPPVMKDMILGLLSPK